MGVNTWVLGCCRTCSQFQFLGKFVLQVSATDLDEKTSDGDGYGDVGYFLEHEFFRIDQKTGEIFVKKSLDREKSSEYSFLVTAEDGGGKRWVLIRTLGRI